MFLPIALFAVLCCASAIAESGPAQSALNPVFVMDAQRDDGRIINGELASPGQFPHQVSLFLNGQFLCGGSIISTTHILTAAHCLRGGSYTVQVGSVKVNEGRTYVVSRIIPHQQYDPQTKINDIGIAKLASPLSFSSSVQAIRLETSMAQPGLPVISSGWGRTNPHDENSYPSHLRYIYMNIAGGCPGTNHPGTVCAMASQGKGICQGDSGGPLITGQNTLVGASSYVILPCGQSGKPDAFAHVPYFINWIQQNMI